MKKIFPVIFPILSRILLVYLCYLWLPYPVFYPVAALILNNLFNTILTYVGKKPLVLTYGIWGLWILVAIVMNVGETDTLQIVLLVIVAILSLLLPIAIIKEYFANKKK